MITPVQERTRFNRVWAAIVALIVAVPLMFAVSAPASSASMICNSYKSASSITVYHPEALTIRPSGRVGVYACASELRYGNISKVKIPLGFHARYSGKCINAGTHDLGRYSAWEYNVQPGRC